MLADRVRIEQVAANLIDNAVKYTPVGGRVVVDVETVDGRAVLRVRDTGLGIAASELPRIWDRLFRGDRSRTDRGLGLGLSLVKAIVYAHGGTVDVSSEPGRGRSSPSLAARPLDKFQNYRASQFATIIERTKFTNVVNSPNSPTSRIHHWLGVSHRDAECTEKTECSVLSASAVVDVRQPFTLVMFLPRP